MYLWSNTSQAQEFVYRCGYCNAEVAPGKMYVTEKKPDSSRGRIYICSHCGQPPFFSVDNKQTPKPLLGRDISNLSNKEIASLYKEARACTSLGAYTAAVMTCRKILMNLAVSEGAKENQSFAFYVDYLFDNGYVPPKGKTWVDSIRKRGNEATHEIRLMEEKDAKLVLDFTEGLMRFNFELPNMLEDDNKQESTKEI